MISKEELKSKAITELFRSGILQKKIEFICVRHSIPLNADIQSDILQVTFEHLCKYNLDKFIKAYKSNPNKILGLAVTIALRKGVYIDKRAAKSWSHSIARQILNKSTIDTLYRIDSCIEDSNDDYNLPQMEPEKIEEDDTSIMWKYVRENLNDEEKILLDSVLQIKPPKMVGQIKKDYLNLLPKLKIIITEWKSNQDN